MSGKRNQSKNIIRVGQFKHNIDVSNTFKMIAKEEEYSAEILVEKNQYRQACYFLIQSMEKYIRSKIFTMVNPNLEYFRKKNLNHSLDTAVESLIEIMSTDEVIRTQISNQIKNYVLNKDAYRYLHNNLRYPAYFDKFNSYSILQVTKKDYDILKNSLESLKIFLSDLDKFK